MHQLFCESVLDSSSTAVSRETAAWVRRLGVHYPEAASCERPVPPCLVLPRLCRRATVAMLMLRAVGGGLSSFGIRGIRIGGALRRSSADGAPTQPLSYALRHSFQRSQRNGRRQRLTESFVLRAISR